MKDDDEIKERIENLEKKIDFIMTMIQKMNENMSLNVINKIENQINEAVDKKINYMKQNKTIRVSMDGGADIR